MSVLEWRGGIPVAYGGSVTTAGVITDDRGVTQNMATAPLRLGANQQHYEEDGRKARGITAKWLEVRNLDTTAANGLRVYFSQVSFNDDRDFVEIPGGASPLSIWVGPYELEEIWIRSTAATPAFRIIAANRRG